MKDDRRRLRLVVVASLAVFVFLGLWLANSALGFPGPWDPNRFQTVPDAAADWLAARAAVDGADPYLELDKLGALYEVEVDPLPEGAANPRFPGGLFFLTPLLLLPIDVAVTAMTVVNLASLAASAWLVWRWWKTPVPALVLPVLAATPPFVELLAHGPHVGPMTLLLVVAWWAAGRSKERMAGIATAVLALVRGFPLLIIPALWRVGKGRAAAIAAGGFVGLNVLGMAAFGISFEEAVTSLSASSSVFGTDVHNSSLAAMLNRFGIGYGIAVWIGGTSVLALWVWALKRAETVDAALLVTVPAMLLASPLSWPTYQYLLLPVVGVLAARGEKVVLSSVALVAAAGWIWWVAAGVSVSGVATFVLFATFSLAAVRSNEREQSRNVAIPERARV